jgi:hypothetical protein
MPARFTRLKILQFCIVALAIFVAATSESRGQQVPVQPSSTHIFPAGGRRGTKVDVRVGGECLPPGTRFRVFGEGVSAPVELTERVSWDYAPSPRRKPSELPVTYPSEWNSRVAIAADAPLGTALWRLGCASGGTGARPFVIGDLPEFIETEPNSTLDHAESVAIPITINGQIAGERDLDYYSFHAEPSLVTVIDIAATRLGSALDPTVQVFDADGRRVHVQDLRVGSDPIIAFRPKAAGIYQLLVAGVSYKGGPSYVYRATITTKPLLQYAFPAGGIIQSKGVVAFLSPDGENGFRTLTLANEVPTSKGLFWRRGDDAANAVPLVAGEFPEATESGENDTLNAATMLTLQQTMNGQFESPHDEDWYRFDASAGKMLSIECTAQAHWSAALPMVELVDANGGILWTGNSVLGLDGTIRTDWTAPTDGTWKLRVRDVQQGIRGGPSHIYRLTVREATPGFSLTTKVDAANVVQGARGEVDVAIERFGGFAGPIELLVDGLPKGIKVEGTTVAPGQPVAKLAFVAENDAPAWDATIQIRGRAEIGGQTIERTAIATHLGHDPDGVGVGDSTIDNLQLTVVHKPVFRLYCNEAYQYAHRGTIYRYLMEIERLGDFNQPIHLQMADRQIKDLDGIEIVNTTIAPGESQTMLPLYLPESMHINVQAHSNVYAQGHVEFVDSAGQKQTMLVVSTMRCMIRTLPTVVKLRTKDVEIAAQRGATVRIPLQLDRTPNFTGPMRIELIDPPAGVTASAAKFEANSTEAAVDVQLSDTELPPSGSMKLLFRAIGQLDAKSEVISETAQVVAVRAE